MFLRLVFMILCDELRHYRAYKLLVVIENTLAFLANAQMIVEPLGLCRRKIAAERQGAEPLALLMGVEGPNVGSSTSSMWSQFSHFDRFITGRMVFRILSNPR